MDLLQAQNPSVSALGELCVGFAGWPGGEIRVESEPPEAPRASLRLDRSRDPMTPREQVAG